MIRRLQRQRQKGWRTPPNTRYCGRPGRYANPYVVGHHRTAEKAVAAYRHALESGQLEYNEDDLLRELSKYDFASCWCREGAPCHVDVIVEVVNAA